MEKYEIVEVHNSKAIPVFAELAVKIRDWNYKYEDLREYFERRFGLPEFKVFVEPNLWGMMAVEILQPMKEQLLSIELLWTDPKKQGLTAEFIKTAEKFAKEVKIKKIITTIKRPSVMKRYSNAERKYGFSPYAIVEIKEIGG